MGCFRKGDQKEFFLFFFFGGDDDPGDGVEDRCGQDIKECEKLGRNILYQVIVQISNKALRMLDSLINLQI